MSNRIEAYFDEKLPNKDLILFYFLPSQIIKYFFRNRLIIYIVYTGYIQEVKLLKQTTELLSESRPVHYLVMD